MNMGPETTANRTPGKYIVWGLGAFAALVFASALVLAVRLTPAAERWRGDAPPAATRR